MTKFILSILSFLTAASLFAGTPAETLIIQYGDVKGARSIEVNGARMRFARPILRRYPIGPMSDVITEVAVLNMGKASVQDRQRFLYDVEKVLRSYRYYGKSDTPDGPVDVYVRLRSNDQVDELVIYNQEKYVLNSLVGEFPVEELLKIGDRSGR